MTATTDENAILEAEQQWIDIYLRNDADALGDILAADFIYTSPEGEVVDRPTYLTNLRDDVVHMAYIHPEDLKVRFYGESTALVTGTWRVSERYRDSSAEGAFRILRVWAREGESWKAAGFQVTAVNPALQNEPPAEAER